MAEAAYTMNPFPLFHPSRSNGSIKIMQLPHLVSAPGDAQVSSSKWNHKILFELAFKCSYRAVKATIFSPLFEVIFRLHKEFCGHHLSEQSQAIVSCTQFLSSNSDFRSVRKAENAWLHPSFINFEPRLVGFPYKRLCAFSAQLEY